MLAVKDIIKMDSGEPVIFCDLFDDSAITDKIKTNIGTFNKTEFEVGNVTACFAPPTARGILLRTKKDCSKIKEIEFV